MWSSWVKRMGTTQVMYIAKLKDGLKRAKKTFSMILERVLKWYDEGGGNHIKKRFLKLKCFSPLKILTFLLIEETPEAFLFLPLFPFSFFLFFQYFLSLFSFYAPSREDLGVLI
jgi:hypothetical protein